MAGNRFLAREILRVVFCFSSLGVDLDAQGPFFDEAAPGMWKREMPSWKYLGLETQKRQNFQRDFQRDQIFAFFLLKCPDFEWRIPFNHPPRFIP